MQYVLLAVFRDTICNVIYIIDLIFAADIVSMKYIYNTIIENI